MCTPRSTARVRSGDKSGRLLEDWEASGQAFGQADENSVGGVIEGAAGGGLVVSIAGVLQAGAEAVFEPAMDARDQPVSIVHQTERHSVGFPALIVVRRRKGVSGGEIGLRVHRESGAGHDAIDLALVRSDGCRFEPGDGFGVAKGKRGIEEKSPPRCRAGNRGHRRNHQPGFVARTDRGFPAGVGLRRGGRHRERR